MQCIREPEASESPPSRAGTAEMRLPSGSWVCEPSIPCAFAVTHEDVLIAPHSVHMQHASGQDSMRLSRLPLRRSFSGSGGSPFLSALYLLRSASVSAQEYSTRNVRLPRLPLDTCPGRALRCPCASTRLGGSGCGNSGRGPPDQRPAETTGRETEAGAAQRGSGGGHQSHHRRRRGGRGGRTISGGPRPRCSGHFGEQRKGIAVGPGGWPPRAPAREPEASDASGVG